MTALPFDPSDDPRPHVFLVPGFFGFANLGELAYFHHVKEVLDAHMKRVGREVQVHRVDTLPTAGITRRAARLLEIIEQHADGYGTIHIIGHSTGAVDARVLLDPARERPETAKLLARIKSVTSVAGAHRGTPLATAFRSAFGKELLKLTAILTLRTLSLGKLPITLVSALTATLAAFDSAVGARPDMLDQLQERLLDNLTPERRAELQALFHAVVDDQALLDELEPRRAQHTDAQTQDRAGVRYGCIIAEGARPGIGSALRVGLSPVAQLSNALYTALWFFAARNPEGPPPEHLDLGAEKVRLALGELPTHESNDGIVPVWSQVHGHILRAVRADHHDVLGHFDPGGHDDDHHPPHIDWLLSGSRFSRAQFVALWTDVAAFILDAERASYLPG